MNLLDETFIVDGCIYPVNDFNGVASQLRRSGNVFFLTVPKSQNGFREAILSISKIYNLVDDKSQEVGIAKTVTDIENNAQEDKVSIILYFQDPVAIENNLNLIKVFYELGLRVIQLTYNQGNFIGSGCLETVDSGITDFGKKVIKEMNRLGMIVDLSHCGEKTTLDAITESEHPCLISHANIKSITDSPRNKTDEELKLLAERGGVVGLTPFGPFCWKGNSRPTLDDYLDHVDYAVDLLGIDHVGYASDGNLDLTQKTDAIYLFDKLYPSLFSEYHQKVGMEQKVRHAKDIKGVHEANNLVEGLMKRNYSSEDVKKILGGNFLRVMKQVWK